MRRLPLLLAAGILAFAATGPPASARTDTTAGRWLVVPSAAIRFTQVWAAAEYAHAWDVKHGADYVAAAQAGGGSSRVAVGACTGFSIPDYIIQRESGGNPNAHNPSGAHGCSQTLLSHYAPGGSCAGLDPYTVDGQRRCTYILSDGGRNLDPWAATR